MEIQNQRAIAIAGMKSFDQGIAGINQAFRVDSHWEHPYNPPYVAVEAAALTAGKAGLSGGLDALKVLLPAKPLVGALTADLATLQAMIDHDNANPNGDRSPVGPAAIMRLHAQMARDELGSFTGTT